MFPFALWNSQSMFISGVMMIIGIMLLRVFASMLKTKQKQNPYEIALRQYSEHQEAGNIAGRMTGRLSPVDFAQYQKNSSEPIDRNHVSAFEFGAIHPHNTERQEAELLTLSRQIKAEIDTKIVALQLMIAEGDRVLQQLGKHLPETAKTSQSTSLPAKPDEVPPNALVPVKPATSVVKPPIHDSQNVSVQANNDIPVEPRDINHIEVEDPFAVNDFGFDKAMRDLDQLTANLPAFDAMQPLDAWDTPTSETHSALTPNRETDQDADTTPAPLPTWDMPMSYPISDYRSATDSEKPTPYSLDSAFHETPSEIHKMPIRRKSNYTNKLLMQEPPQLDTLMTDEPVRKMGSKPHRSTGQAANLPANDESFAPPVIPTIPPPNAQSILVESTPLYQTEESGLDKMAVRKAKRHQLQFLIEKGMSPKEIASHLEMPVGEVELIFSLHKRLASESAKKVHQPRIIAAENVVME